MMEREEEAKNHRWFAVECNNNAWNLAAKHARTGDEDEEMVRTAHAAAFHWSKVGTPLHQLRAWVLLAHVHAQVGRGVEALRYAKQSVAFCQNNRCEDWDLAFAHAELAFAAAVTRDAALQCEHHAMAKRLGEAIGDEVDRKIFLEEFARIPAPDREVKAHPENPQSFS